ncbi:MAG: STAS domain-containing protein [Terriglobia bacterium]
MSVQIRKTDKATILDLEGPLKLGETEQSFRDSVRALLESGTRNVAINLSGVPMMDSSGVGALVRAFSSVKRGGGRCKVFGVRKQVMQLLKMVCLDRVLDLVEDEDSALSSFEAR